MTENVACMQYLVKVLHYVLWGKYMNLKNIQWTCEKSSLFEEDEVSCINMLHIVKDIVIYDYDMALTYV